MDAARYAKEGFRVQADGQVKSFASRGSPDDNNVWLRS
jgi:hypothetical protein